MSEKHFWLSPEYSVLADTLCLRPYSGKKAGARWCVLQAGHTCAHAWTPGVGIRDHGAPRRGEGGA